MSPSTGKKSQTLKNKKILLGISGSIAIQKIPSLVEKLTEKGAQVKIILTESANQLLHPSVKAKLMSLTQNQVHQDLFEAENPMRHIDLTRETDLFLIAPISATSLARLAEGKASDLLSATALASNQKVMLAPAMNREMFEHPTTQRNLDWLKKTDRFIIIPPDTGRLACNEYGIGRLVEIEVLVNQIEDYFQSQKLAGKSVLMTVGATIEPIDPVRYISNFSSGKMGYAIASSFLALGAELILIQGQVKLSHHYQNLNRAKIISITTAQEMLEACLQALNELGQSQDEIGNSKCFDFFVASAAVSDYRVKNRAPEKMKKNQNELTLELVKNEDILKTISHLKVHRPKTVIGFAAETENLIENATKKLIEKKLDFICANEVGQDKAFGKDENELMVLTKNKEIHHLKPADKRILAHQLVQLWSRNI